MAVYIMESFRLGKGGMEISQHCRHQDFDYRLEDAEAGHYFLHNRLYIPIISSSDASMRNNLNIILNNITFLRRLYD